MTDLFDGSHVDDLSVYDPGVEILDDLTHGLGTHQLAAGQHSLH